MSDWLHGVRVPPLSVSDIRELGTLFRRASSLKAVEPFPVLYFFEHSMAQAVEGFDFLIVDSLPDGDEACAYPDGCLEHQEGPFIKLTAAVYDGAAAGKGRHRLTILHECAHVILHRRVAVHHRGPKGAELKPYENSEWQANQLAAELLMPPESFATYPSLTKYCKGMGVSLQAAELRIAKLVARKELVTPTWSEVTGTDSTKGGGK